MEPGAQNSVLQQSRGVDKVACALIDCSLAAAAKAQ